MNLKVLAICATGLLMSGRTLAQVRGEQSPQLSTPPSYAREIKKYNRMATIGVILTVVGAGLLVSGTNTIEESSSVPQQYDSSSPTGLYCTVAGMACLGAGVPMCIVGIRKSFKYKKLNSVTVGISTTPQLQGLTLTYRF